MKTDIIEELTNHIFNSMESDENTKSHNAFQKFFKNKIKSSLKDFFKEKICIVHEVDDVDDALTISGKDPATVSNDEKVSLLKSSVLQTYENLDSILGKGIVQIVVEDEMC